MQFYLEPLAEHGERTFLRPCGFVRMPAEEFAIEDLSNTCFNDPLRALIKLDPGSGRNGSFALAHVIMHRPHVITSFLRVAGDGDRC